MMSSPPLEWIIASNALIVFTLGVIGYSLRKVELLCPLCVEPQQLSSQRRGKATRSDAAVVIIEAIILCGIIAAASHPFYYPYTETVTITPTWVKHWAGPYTVTHFGFNDGWNLYGDYPFEVGASYRVTVTHDRQREFIESWEIVK